MIPEHLRSTHTLLTDAYPAGVPDVDYFAVLALLYEHLSDRNLAEVVSLALGRDRGVAYNDVARCLSTDQPTPESVCRVKARLQEVGFEAWSHDEYA
jgi:hypothetical protein